VTHEFGSFDNREGADYFPVADNGRVGAGRRGLTIDFSLAGPGSDRYSSRQQEVRDDALPNDDRHLEYLILSSLF